ncbi:MAG: serine/threonine protein kinase, partial [Myxococcales bacterium]|nr:serine/threonine protein kinase [Myxococcales bacterium]
MSALYPSGRRSVDIEPVGVTDEERARYADHALRRFAKSYGRSALGGAIGAAVVTLTCLFNQASWARAGAITGALLVVAQLGGAFLAKRLRQEPRFLTWYNAGVGFVGASGVGVATAIGDGFASWGGVVIVLFWIYGSISIGLGPRYLALVMAGHTLAFTVPGLLIGSATGVGAFAIAIGLAAVACLSTSWLREITDRRYYVTRVRRQKAQRDLAEANRQLQLMEGELAARVDGQLATILEKRQDVQRLHRLLHAPTVDSTGEIARVLGPAPIAALPETYQPGAIIGGRARVERFLASGGFGDVFLATDLTLREEVVVKVMRPSTETTPSDFKRFLLEAAAASAVQHEAIVRIYHVDIDGRGSPFILSEHIAGTTLGRIIDDGPIPAAAAVSIATVVVDALAAVHRAGLVHRDIKPDNIMLTTATPGVKLLDFGVSQFVNESFDLTNAGQLIGSVGYMAPERFRSRDGESEAGAPSDVFSVGMLLWECIAGAHPFDQLQTFAIVARMARGAIPRLEPRPDLPTALIDFIEIMLAPD